MACGSFRWLLSAWIFTQVTVFSAAEPPVHVELKLDGKESPSDGKLPSNRVIIWYNTNDAANPGYKDLTKKTLVESAGLKRLYIRGTFEIKVDKGDEKHFHWDKKSKGAQDLSKFILKIFKKDCVVVVVFPDVLHTYAGFEFQSEFEDAVQKENEQITVGRGVINVYLGFGELEGKTLLDAEREKQLAKQYDFEKHEKYYSIFANYDKNTFSFSTAFTQWHTPANHVNIFRVKIQEADSVLVRLVSACSQDQNGLKVGSRTAEKLADILLKLLRVKEVETHPKQRIRVELPKECGNKKEREDYTGLLVDTLQHKNLHVYGKEPVVHLQIHDKESKNDVAHVTKMYPQDIVAEIGRDISTPVTDDVKNKVSLAKELFIHFHCHGRFYASTICEHKFAKLADIMSNYIKKTLLDRPVPKIGIVIFHVCEAGSKGQKYVIDFLSKFAQLLQNHGITIQESVSYTFETSHINEHIQVVVPDTCSLYPLMVNEKHVFGRFTVRTIKDDNNYIAFNVLPLTEYVLHYKN